MRFKRLKTNVAVSLVIFVLVVGSIIFVGLSNQRHGENDDNRVVLGAPVYTVKDGGVLIQPTNTQTQTNTQPVQNNVNIFNAGIRTRAS